MKKMVSLTFTLVLLCFAGQAFSQSSKCCDGSKKVKSELCCSKTDQSKTTSGCTPSACRGAQTKFGEAKVITSLRQELIDLKAHMETYQAIRFDERSYSIHGIVGDSDDESIAIIADEVRIIEGAFSSLMKKSFKPFSLPENKAKQVVYLKERISSLSAMLKA